MAIEPFAQLETTPYEVPAPKDDSISTKSMAKAIDEATSSHYSAPPRVGKGSIDFTLAAMRKEQTQV